MKHCVNLLWITRGISHFNFAPIATHHRVQIGVCWSFQHLSTETLRYFSCFLHMTAVEWRLQSGDECGRASGHTAVNCHMFVTKQRRTQASTTDELQFQPNFNEQVMMYRDRMTYQCTQDTATHCCRTSCSKDQVYIVFCALCHQALLFTVCRLNDNLSIPPCHCCFFLCCPAWATSLDWMKYI